MSLLRNRQYALLFSGQLVSMLGNSLFFLALPWYVYLSTGSKADLAIVGFAQSLPGATALFAGVFVDRWNKRKTLIGSDAIRLVLALAVGIVALFGWPFPWIVMLVLLLQFAGVCFSPAEAVLIPMVVGEEQVAAAMGLNQSGSATAQLAGQVGGGALLTALGAPLLFLLDGASFLVSVLSLLFIRASEPPRRQTSTSFFAEWKEGLALVVRSKLIILLTVAALVTNFGTAAFDIALTAWVRGPLHGTAFWLGIIGGAFFVGVTGGGALLGMVTKRVSLRVTLMAGLLVAGACIGSIGAFADEYWTMGILLVCGVSIGILNGSLGAMLVTVIPQQMRGRVFGLLGALSTIATPLGMAVFGGLMIYIPLAALFAVMGSLTLLSGLSFLLPVKDDLANLRSVGQDVSAP